MATLDSADFTQLQLIRKSANAAVQAAKNSEGTVSNDLNVQASRLNNQALMLIAGMTITLTEDTAAGLQAQQIDAAIAQTAAVIERITQARDTLTLVTGFAGFIASVFTGNVPAIFAAAVSLKSQVDGFSQKYPATA
jgi:hypothetical protein